MFSLVVAFSILLRAPLDFHFGAILAGAGATILPLKCPWRPLEPLLELSWAPIGLTGPSLDGLWDSLWSFGWVLSLRCEVAEVWVLEHLGHRQGATILLPGAFCAREASFWVPGPPLTPLWVSPGVLGALSVLSLCSW